MGTYRLPLFFVDLVKYARIRIVLVKIYKEFGQIRSSLFIRGFCTVRGISNCTKKHLAVIYMLLILSQFYIFVAPGKVARNKGLSGGAIAAIVIVIILLVLIAVDIFCCFFNQCGVVHMCAAACAGKKREKCKSGIFGFAKL